MFDFQDKPAIVRTIQRLKHLDLSRDARRRLQWFVYYLDHDCNTSRTCRYFGIARSTFIRWANRFEPEAPYTLEDHSRRPKHVRQPETPDEVVHYIDALRKNNPRMSREKIVERLREFHDVTISPATVGRIIKRHGLFYARTPSQNQKRRKVLDDLSDIPSLGMCLLAACAALLTGGLFTTGQAQAAESADYILEQSIGTNANADDAESSSYIINNASLTWIEKIGSSDSYEFGTPVTTSDSGDTGGTTGGGSGGGSQDSDGGSGGSRGGSRGSRTGAPTASTQPSTGTADSTSDSPGVPLRAAPPPADTYLFEFPQLEDRVTAVVTKVVELPANTNLDQVHPAVIEVEPGNGDAKKLLYIQYRYIQTRDTALLLLVLLQLITIVGLYIHIRYPHVVTSAPVALKAKKVVATKRKKKPASGFAKRTLTVVLAMGVSLLSAHLVPAVLAATTTPQQIVYNGQLKNSSGNAITTAHVMRFSFWSDADYVSADILVDGSIDTSRSTYAGWQEELEVTPTSTGDFSLNLGSDTALPALSSLTVDQLNNLHMQVEVKQQGEADTAYQLMDVNASDTIDRAAVQSVPFALNADLLDQRDTGTGSGNIAVLGSGGLFDVSHIPAGTNRSDFTIDFDDTETSLIGLTFGSSLSKTLAYDIANSRFNFNDDVYISGDLTVTGLVNGIDIDALIAAETSALKVSTGAGLNINVSEGNYRINGDVTNYAGLSNVSVTDDATNYIFFGSGGLNVSTVGFPTDESAIRLAEVVTSGGSITTVSDRRILMSDDREQSVSERFSAGFEHVVFQADATNNVGQLTESHDNTNLKNYYSWTSTADSLQDYDLIVRVPLSPNFSGWIDNPLQVSYRATSANNTDAKLDVSVYDTNGNPVTLSGSTTGLTGTSWSTAQIEFTGSPTWTAGTEFLVKFKVSAKSNFQIHLGGFLLQFKEFFN